jgi:tetratricopeptide (TPR) repeat protein
MKDLSDDGAPSSLPLEELYALTAVARRWAEHGRVEDAQAILAGLADLEPDRSFLRTGLGCLFMKLGRVEDALAQFAAALERDPGDVAALTHAGELNLERGERARGLELLSAAAERDPEETSPHANRARTLRALTTAETEA